jgi:hypothetical protein
MARKLFCILLTLMLFTSVSAQTIKDSGYRAVGYVKEDGTVQDASYHIVGYAKGIPLRWAAFYFFFRQ